MRPVLRRSSEPPSGGFAAARDEIAWQRLALRRQAEGPIAELEEDHMRKGSVRKVATIGSVVIVVAVGVGIYLQSNMFGQGESNVLIEGEKPVVDGSATRERDNSGAEKAEVSREEGPPETTEPVMVEIAKTPSGWVDVREGPGTKFARVTSVNPGEKYELLEKGSDGIWFKIKVDDSREGWVYAMFTKDRFQ